MTILGVVRSLLVRSVLPLAFVLAFSSVAMPLHATGSDVGDTADTTDGLTCASLQYSRLFTAAVVGDALLTVEQGEDVTTTFKVTQESVVTVPRVAFQALLVTATEEVGMPVYPVYAGTVLHDGLTFEPGDTREFTSSLTIPTSLAPGLYEIVLVASQGRDSGVVDRTGITADDLLAKQTVVVTGDVSPLVFVDDGLMIDDTFMSFGDTHTLANSEPIAASLQIENQSTSTPIRGTLTWSLYEGMLPRVSDLVTSRVDTIKLVPAGGRTTSFVLKTPSDNLPIGADVPDHERLFAAAYLLAVTLEIDGEVEQVRYVPLVRTDTVGLPAAAEIDSLTLRSVDSQTELLTCVSYPVPQNEAETVHITLEASSQDGLLGAHTDTVAPGNQLVGQQTPIVVTVGPSTGPLTVAITLSRGLVTDVPEYLMPKFLARTVDSVSMPISCDQHVCVTPTPSTSKEQPPSPLTTWVGMCILGIIAFLPVLGAYQVICRSRRRRRYQDDDTHTPHPFDKDIHGI